MNQRSSPPPTPTVGPPAPPADPATCWGCSFRGLLVAAKGRRSCSSGVGGYDADAHEEVDREDDDDDDLGGVLPTLSARVPHGITAALVVVVVVGGALRWFGVMGLVHISPRDDMVSTPDRDLFADVLPLAFSIGDARTLPGAASSYLCSDPNYRCTPHVHSPRHAGSRLALPARFCARERTAAAVRR